MAQVEGPRTDRQLPWYRGISGYAWLVLVVAALGWLFDTLDQQLFTLIRFRSLQDILSAYHSGPELDAAVQQWGYKLTSIFLVGWAAGGLLFGILGDKIGRARTMMITILIYALFTGLNALVHTPLQYAFCRFFTALGIGGEFAAGASLVAEVWPARSRPMALGFLQALSTVGNMMAAVVTFLLAEVSWRWVYVVGIAPALLVVVIRLFIREPEKWVHARAQTAADPTRELGSIRDLFTLPGVSRNTWAALLIALAGVLGLWGIGYFQPDLISKVMQAAGASESGIQRAKSTVFFIFQIGGFIGMYSYAAASERIGRKSALLIIYLCVLVVVQGAFWTIHSVTHAYAWAFFLGFFTLSPFSAFAVYFPELFPTRLRSTGVGVCYNCARLLAAVGIFYVGSIAATFSRPADPVFGYRVAASIMSVIYVFGFIGLALAPETKGRPLPE